MWNSYWNGRARRDVPQVNYNESSEDDFDSPLQSPQRPPPTRAGSPVELAVPTLADNVDEELAAVSRTLNNVGHTHTFRGTRPTIRPDPEGVEQEVQEPLLPVVADEVLEEHEVHLEVVGGGDGGAVCAGNENANMPDAVDFEDESGQDGSKAMEHTRTLKLEWNPQQVKFWFTQLENEMYTCEVKSQWLKRCVLVKNLPPKVQSDVMSLLTLKKTEAPDLIYKEIKTEILRLYAPEEEETYKKALGRVLVGLPSQLGQQLVNDLCDKPVKLSCGCCAKAVKTLWTLQLPNSVKGHIANMRFDKDTYNDVFKAADKVFLSTKTAEMAPSVAAIVNVPQDSTTAPELAAVGQWKQKNQKGKGKGQGQQKGQNQNSGQSKPDTRKRHSSNPPSSCCDNHYKFADQAWFCLAPITCPYVNKVVAKPEKKNKN